MKCLAYAAALALAVQSCPAFATPSYKLIPLSPKHVAIVSSHCNADAAISGTPAFDMPFIAEEMGASGTAQVRVDLAVTGALARASLFATSGNYWLDEAALRGARLNRYIPETVNCQHVAGSYLIDVEF